MPTPKPISLKDVIAEIEIWFAEQIQKPPLSYEVSVYNQAHAAVESLKDRLAKLIAGKASATPEAEAEAPSTKESKPAA